MKSLLMLQKWFNVEKGKGAVNRMRKEKYLLEY